jgi:hypothetical protein
MCGYIASDELEINTLLAVCEASDETFSNEVFSISLLLFDAVDVTRKQIYVLFVVLNDLIVTFDVLFQTGQFILCVYVRAANPIVAVVHAQGVTDIIVRSS